MMNDDDSVIEIVGFKVAPKRAAMKKGRASDPIELLSSASSSSDDILEISQKPMRPRATQPQPRHQIPSVPTRGGGGGGGARRLIDLSSPSSLHPPVARQAQQRRAPAGYRAVDRRPKHLQDVNLDESDSESEDEGLAEQVMMETLAEAIPLGPTDVDKPVIDLCSPSSLPSPMRQLKPAPKPNLKKPPPQGRSAGALQNHSPSPASKTAMALGRSASALARTQLPPTSPICKAATARKGILKLSPTLMRKAEEEQRLRAQLAATARPTTEPAKEEVMRVARATQMVAQKPPLWHPAAAAAKAPPLPPGPSLADEPDAKPSARPTGSDTAGDSQASLPTSRGEEDSIASGGTVGVLDEAFDVADWGDFGVEPALSTAEPSVASAADVEPKEKASHFAIDTPESPQRPRRAKRARSEPMVDDGSEASEDDGQGDLVDVPYHMTVVEHLSTLSIDPKTGLPLWRFLAHGDDDEILYELQVHVAPSKIPGGGNGAFLTFVGGRRLTKKARERGRAELEKRVLRDVETKGTLTARLPSGYNYAVKLRGENLHGNNNNDFWPMDETVDVDNAGAGYLKPKPFGIGHLGIHSISDYRDDPSIEFSTEQNSVLLGRYGPFRRQDRKIDIVFDLKDFIFSFEPSEWAFGVQEWLFGHPQIIDITDDSTGSPHDIAQRNVCMYVNEIGHGGEFKQNTYIREQEGRVVPYYYHDPEPLQPGESVELLTTYFAQYEIVRERKGYGLANLLGVEKSDDDRCCRFQRNFLEREKVESEIKAENFLSTAELVEYTEFLVLNIWRPLANMANAWLEGNGRLMSKQQLVAMARLRWVRKSFLEKIDDLEKSTLGDPSNYPYEASFALCRGLLGEFESPVFARILRHRATDDGDESIQNLARALREEFMEEACYDTLDAIRNFSPTLWCPLAMKLIEDLCYKAANVLATGYQEHSDIDEALLLESFYRLAQSAATNVQGIIRDKGDKLEELAFDSGLVSLDGTPSMKDVPQEDLDSIKKSQTFFLDNTAVPKGFQAAVFDKLLQSELEIGRGRRRNPDRKATVLNVMDKFVMVEYGALESKSPLLPLASVPCSLSSFGRRAETVNLKWYVVWQIGYPVRVFGKKFLPKFSDEHLCKLLGISLDCLEFAVERGVRRGKEKLFRKCLVFQQKTLEPRQLFAAGTDADRVEKRSNASSKKSSIASKNESASSEPSRSSSNELSKNKATYIDATAAATNGVMPDKAQPTEEEKKTKKKKHLTNGVKSELVNVVSNEASKPSSKPMAAAEPSSPSQSDKTSNEQENSADNTSPKPRIKIRIYGSQVGVISNGQQSSSSSQKKQKTPRNGMLAPEKIYDGPPNCELGGGYEWTPGWRQETYRRANGESRGGIDSYWFSPQIGLRLRSKVSIRRFMDRIRACGGDEKMARVGFKPT